MRPGNRAARSAAVLLTGAAVLGWCGSARAERTIHSFPGVQIGPDLTADRAGNLYGVTGGRFTICSSTSCGTVFRLVPPAAKGQAWTEQTLYTFPASGANGEVSAVNGGQLAVDGAGNLYGTCLDGGSAGKGTVWRLSPPPVQGGAWRFTLVHSFTGGSDGESPEGGVVMDHAGTLYGTTAFGGGTSNDGVVFSLTPPPVDGTTWTETVLHAFGPRRDAAHPFSPLVLSSHETILTGVSPLYFYGRHGQFQNGAVFRLRRQGSSWTYHLLYQFPGPSGTGPVLTGLDPNGPVVVDGNNNIFGTTAGGGSAGGVVFELSPPAQGQSDWTEHVTYDFSGIAGGNFPQAGLVAGGSPPALFGTTSNSSGRAVDGSTGNFGQVFRLDPPASGTGPWTYTALHAFAVKYQQRPIGGYPGPLTLGLHRFLFGVVGLGEKKFSGPFVYVVSPRVPAARAGAAP